MFIRENAKFIRIDISSDFLDLFFSGPIIFVQSNVPICVIQESFCEKLEAFRIIYLHSKFYTCLEIQSFDNPESNLNAEKRLT